MKNVIHVGPSAQHSPWQGSWFLLALGYITTVFMALYG
jgi:hypothetical protein